MSLKAKIEAVIYAAEEPVTLAQLVSLLGQEAQAELDRLESTRLESTRLESAQQKSAQPTPSLDGAEPHPSASLRENEHGAAARTPAEPADEEAHPSAPPPDDKEEADDPSADPGEQAKAAARMEKARAGRLREYLREVLDGLVEEYAGDDRGLEIGEVAGGFRFATKPEYHDAVRGFVRSLKPPLKLTLQALETLAVVAYKQPVTAPEISEIRGVDSGGVLGSLMARKLIATAGRKHVIGRPILYKTTRDFLLRFGLKDVGELPSIEEFEKMAGDLTEAEPHQEEIAMAEDVVATPEGDNEFPPDQPLVPLQGNVIVQGGGAPIPYDADKAADAGKAAHSDEEAKTNEAEAKHHGILEVIDELSRGKMQT